MVLPQVRDGFQLLQRIELPDRLLEVLSVLKANLKSVIRGFKKGVIMNGDAAWERHSRDFALNRPLCLG
jgi:hypothetical protein